MFDDSTFIIKKELQSIQVRSIKAGRQHHRVEHELFEKVLSCCAVAIWNAMQYAIWKAETVAKRWLAALMLVEKGTKTRKGTETVQMLRSLRSLAKRERESEKIQIRRRDMSGNRAIESMIEQQREQKGEIVLERVAFGEVEGRHLVEELLKEQNLHVYSLQLVRVAVDAQGGKWLGELLVKSLLKKFGVRLSQVDETGRQQIIEGIAHSTSLEVVELMNLSLMEQASFVLCEMLCKNESLRELCVWGNSLQKGIVDVVQTALEQKRLTKLDVGENKMPEEAIWRICASLKKSNTCLRSIDMSSSRFDADLRKALAELLKGDCVLKELCLSNCELGDEGVVLIAHALHCNSSLKKINLSENLFGVAGGKAIALMLQANSCLQSLVCSYNNLMGDACTAMCDAMKGNRSIIDFDVSDCNLENEDLKEVATMLKMNPVLQTMDISDINMRDEGAEAIALALEGHKSLYKLNWPHMTQNAKERCKGVLWGSNASLINCGKDFQDVCKRNYQLQQRAREAVQTIRVLRNGKPNMLHMLPKDIVKIIGETVWATRTNIKFWALDEDEKIENNCTSPY